MGFSKKLYSTYKKNIFPRVESVRGSHKLLVVLKKLASRGVEKIRSEPESIFEKENWDNLIILDACRHDLYEEVKAEEIDSRISLGSTTAEYIQRTFSEGDFEDIVYVSANPFFSDSMLNELVGSSDIFEAKFNVFEDYWDENEGTVMPESVVERAELANKLFPDKKIIVHFIQPHYPFIGFEKGSRFGEADKWGEGESEQSVWDRAEKGDLIREEVWEAYKSNLEKVLPRAEELANLFEGKTVITSDHGNLVGENGLYGHPDGMKSLPLRKVPWEVVNE